jgi:hypothetical protein
VQRTVNTMSQTSTPSTSPCRCGYQSGDAHHPCHGKGYTCGKPATMRFYNARPVALAGVMPKVQADGTWACDECWAWFQEYVKTQLGKR